MEKDELRELMREFYDSPLSMLEIEDGDLRVRMEKPVEGAYPPCPPMPPMHHMGPPPNGGQPPFDPQQMYGQPPYGQPPQGAPAAGAGMPGQMPPQNPPATSPVQAQQAARSEEDAWIAVKAPLVGVFYTSPSPDDPPYVTVGDHVEEGDVICLVEAMKMINEIKAPQSGTVRKVLLNAGDPVGYDDEMILIEADE